MFPASQSSWRAWTVLIGSPGVQQTGVWLSASRFSKVGLWFHHGMQTNLRLPR